MKTRRIIAAIAVCAAPLVLSACGSSESAIPNLKGVWKGHYEFPANDKTVRTSELSLEITKQEGTAIWGVETWMDKGTVMHADLLGSLSTDNTSVILAEVGGFFSGNIGDNSMRLRFVRTDDPPTAFVVTVTRGN